VKTFFSVRQAVIAFLLVPGGAIGAVAADLLPAATQQTTVIISTAPAERTNREKLTDPDVVTRRNAAIYLGAERNKEHTPYLIPLLQDAAVDVRRAAITALAHSGDARAVTPLVELFKQDQNHAVKLSIIMALGDLKARAALPLLTGLLKEQYAGYRNEAVRALGKINDPQTYQDIVRMLGDESEGVKVMAADVVRDLKIAAAGPLLLSNLTDVTAVVRSSAAKALGVVGKSAAIPELEKLVQDTDKSVSTAAQEAIALIKTRASAAQQKK
jgi:HEAT repeat protein